MGLASVLPFLSQMIKQQQPAATPDQVQPAPDPNQLPQPQLPGPMAQGLPPAPTPPEQTKGHKLLQLLQGGLVGGLSGLAANAQTYAATGRNAGFGGGLAGGFGGAQTSTLPFQQQEKTQQLAQQQAQTKLTQQQGDMVQTPYGLLPATLAKMIFPATIAAGGKVEAAKVGATSRENVAQTQQQTQENIHRFIPVQGVGLFDSQTKQVVPDTGKGITVTPEIAADHQLPQQFVGKQMQLSDFNSMMRFENQQSVVAQGTAGPSLVNKKTKQVTPLGLGNPGMGKPMEVGDPETPGQTKVVTGQTAVADALPGKGSASVAVPKRAAEAEVPTKIGDQKVAFTTMIQHADLLRRAAKALNNGDVQSLSGLENAFKNEFGYSGPITSSAIADAYKGEVSNVINKGHITDQGNEKIAHTLDPTRQNYQTIDSVLGAYQALAQSKMNMLNQQQQNAINKSQPKGKTIHYKIVNGALVPQQ